MNISFDSPTKVKSDDSWQVQGRVIPPSCSGGEGCILHIQARNPSWSGEHFHIGRTPISTEAALEFAISMLVPYDEELYCCSFDPDELENGIDYLKMVKLDNPKDTLAFLTVTGLTIVVQIPGIEGMFGASSKCSHCSVSSSNSAVSQLVVDPEGNFDSLMEMKEGEKFH